LQAAAASGDCWSDRRAPLAPLIALASGLPGIGAAIGAGSKLLGRFLG
jgi:hypothetical protein